MTISYPYKIDGSEYNSEVIEFDLSDEDIIMIDSICKKTKERRDVAIKRILMEYLERMTNGS